MHHQGPAELHHIMFVQTRAAAQHTSKGLKLHNTLQTTSARAELTATCEGPSGSRLPAYLPVRGCRTRTSNVASMPMCKECLGFTPNNRHTQHVAAWIQSSIEHRCKNCSLQADLVPSASRPVRAAEHRQTINVMCNLLRNQVITKEQYK